MECILFLQKYDKLLKNSGRVKSKIVLRFIIGKVMSKDLKRGPTEAKQEISNYLDNSGVPWGLRW